MEGNQMKMREALETVRKYVKETTPDKVMLGVIEVWCDEALAAPPRQCDVGTAEEQYERFRAACKAFRQHDDPDYCSSACPIDGNGDCHEKWAQMPYTAKEGETDGV